MAETSLKISDNSVVADSVSISCNRAFRDLYPWQNVLGGGRYSFAVSAAEHDSVQFDFKSNVAIYLDHVIFADWDITANGATYALSASTNGTDYFSVAKSTEVVAQNYINYYSLNSSKYWRLILTASAARTWVIGKIFIGQFLDLACEPDNYSANLIKAERKFYSDSNNISVARTNKPKNQIELSWAGVSDALAINYFDRIIERQNNRKFMLVAKTYTKVLNGLYSLIVETNNAARQQSESLPNWNYLSGTFNEVVK